MRLISDNHHLLQTFVETDRTLSKWANHLTRDKELELGDDPQLVEAIEHDLRKMANRMQLLERYFSLKEVSLRDANYYFAVTDQIEQAVSLMTQISQNAFGSQQQTYQILGHLRVCTQRVHELMDRLMLAPKSPIQ